MVNGGAVSQRRPLSVPPVAVVRGQLRSSTLPLSQSRGVEATCVARQPSAHRARGVYSSGVVTNRSALSKQTDRARHGLAGTIGARRPRGPVAVGRSGAVVGSHERAYDRDRRLRWSSTSFQERSGEQPSSSARSSVFASCFRFSNCGGVFGPRGTQRRFSSRSRACSARSSRAASRCRQWY